MATVRPAGARDTDALLALTEEMDRFYGVTDFESEAVRREQIHAALFSDDSSAHVLVACDPTGTPCGFAAYSFLWPAVGLTRSLYLKELYVAQHAQRCGIGSQLMHAVIAAAQETNCSRIEWTTDRDNPAAQAFYKTLGFEALSSKIFYRHPSP